ncbi:secreted protein [Candidatus Magnetomorum sp. HK-1]|nr:secreted protein [Candidatus Magnetomorum sp. HK-1]
MFNRILVLNYFFAAFLVMAPCSYALEYTLQPRFMVGYMSYSFKDNVSSFTDNSIDFKAGNPYGGFGTTLTHKNYYVDIYWQQELENFSHSESTSTNDMITVNDTNLYSYSLDKKVDAQFGRKDFAITIGLIKDNITVFAGYKRSRSFFDMGNNYETEKRIRENELEPYYYKTFYLNTDNIDYENRSLFVGCGYSFFFKHGSLGGKIAISNSKMEVIRNYSSGVYAIPEDINNINDEDDRIFSITRQKSKKDVVGFSLGAEWRGNLRQFSKYFNYVFSLNAVKCKSDDVEDLVYTFGFSVIWTIPFKASLNY